MNLNISNSTLLPHLLATLSLLVLPSMTTAETVGIWTTAQELASLPTSGPAWEGLMDEADHDTSSPNVSDQDDNTNVQVLAKALIYARTGQESFRLDVIQACMAAIGTEAGGRTLALGRELGAYVIAADLVGLPAADDQLFRTWLRSLLTMDLDGKTLQSTHEVRPNNWGTDAGASRAAVAVYLGDRAELDRVATVFHGWVGDRTTYDGFKFGELAWQSNPGSPVAINPVGAMKDGHSIDGVLPDDQRRGGGFKWPPPHENYVWQALQGALAQAIILHRQGYDVWNWEDRALLRALRWLNDVSHFTAVGDDEWLPHIVNHFYGTNFPATVPAQPGKNLGYTDWIFGPGAGTSPPSPPQAPEPPIQHPPTT